MVLTVIDHPSRDSSRKMGGSSERIGPDATLLALIRKYEQCSRALERIADQVPTSLDEAEDLDQEEARLHDQRAELLGLVTAHDPKSLDDVRALLKLWHIETIIEQPRSAVTVSDRLVLKACQFLNVF